VKFRKQVFQQASAERAASGVGQEWEIAEHRIRQKSVRFVITSLRNQFAVALTEIRLAHHTRKRR